MTKKLCKIDIKIFNVNFSDINSIKYAERKKNMLENKGYNLKKTRQIGFDKFLMKYERKVCKVK